MDENISRAAGASHGQEARRARASARSSSRSAARSSSAPRSTAGPRTVGRRLRPPPDARPTPTAAAARRVGRSGRRHPVRAVTPRAPTRRPRRLDVVGDRQRAGRRPEPRDATSSSTTHGLVKGAMALIDTERAETLYAAMGPAVEISGGSAANTIVGRRVVRRHAPRSSAGSPTTSSARCSRHDLRAAGVRVRHAARDRRAPTGRCLVIVTPDARAHACTPTSARRRELDPDDVDARLIARRAGHVPRGLPLGRARRQGRVPRRGRASRTRPGSRVALTLSDPLLRRPPPRRVPRARSSTTSTSSSPTKPRSRCSTRSTTSTTRSQRVQRPLRDRRAHPRASRAR